MSNLALRKSTSGYNKFNFRFKYTNNQRFQPNIMNYIKAIIYFCFNLPCSFKLTKIKVRNKILLSQKCIFARATCD